MVGQVIKTIPTPASTIKNTDIIIIQWNENVESDPLVVSAKMVTL